MDGDIRWSQIACEVSERAAALNVRGSGQGFDSEESQFVTYQQLASLDLVKWWHVFAPLFRELLRSNSGVSIATLGQFIHPSENLINRTWINVCSIDLTVESRELAGVFAAMLGETIEFADGISDKLSRVARLTTDALDAQSRGARVDDGKLLKPFGVTFSPAMPLLQHTDSYTVECCSDVDASKTRDDLLSRLKANNTDGTASALGNLWLRAMCEAVGAETVLAIPGWLPPEQDGVHTGVLVLYLKNDFDSKQLPGVISAYRAGCLMYLGVSEKEKIENLRQSRERLKRIMPELDDLLEHSREVGDRASAIRRKLDPSATKFLRHNKKDIELLFRRSAGHVLYPTGAGKVGEPFGLRRCEEGGVIPKDFKRLKTAHLFSSCNWKSETEGSYSDFFETASRLDNWNEPWMKPLASVDECYANDAFNFAKLMLHRPLFEAGALFEAQLFFGSWYATCWTTDNRPSIGLFAAANGNKSFSHREGNSGQFAFDEFFKVFGIASQVRRRTENFLSDMSNDALVHPGSVTSIEFLSAFMEFLEELSPDKGSVCISSVKVFFDEPGAVVDVQCKGKLSNSALTITPTSSGRGFRGALGELCEGFNQSQLLLGSHFGLDHGTAATQLLGKLTGFYRMESETGIRFLLSFARRLPAGSKGGG